MLDLNLLVKQIEQVGLESFAEREDQADKLAAGQDAIFSVAANPDKFLEKAKASKGRVLWPVAKPLEPIDVPVDVPPHTTPVTVVGVDGSQIMPSHHEVHTCYLLNVGCVVIAYGNSTKPILESRPRLFHRPEDLYPLVDRRRVHIDELYVSLERTILELQTLAELAVGSMELRAAVVAFVDGSLIPWSVEKLSEKYQAHFLERLAATMKVFQDNAIPIVGYLSSSRATDVVNMLRVDICPYDISDCRVHCGQLNEEAFPCSKIWPLSDRQLFYDKLVKGQRSSAFMSGAAVMRNWQEEQRICFSYIHVGSEIARVEFPGWLMQKPQILEQAFAVVMAQANKGMGYPICLAEAHHLAVIRGHERTKFFELLATRMVDLGLPKIRQSPKETLKRTGFV